LGTALLPTDRPRALLIDEIDKCDLDLPNDLLHIFEEGEFTIPELERLDQEVVEIREENGEEYFPIRKGHVRCRQFPFIIMTSNGEREFPAPFLRRCLQLEIDQPDEQLLNKIVRSHLGDRVADEAADLVSEFMSRRSEKALATDQLLNALFMLTGGAAKNSSEEEKKKLIEALLRSLSNAPSACWKTLSGC
jgi:MoxR-like ATPase